MYLALQLMQINMKNYICIDYNKRAPYLEKCILASDNSD